MKILIHDYSGHPFQVQLSRKLASCGYDVIHVFCSSFSTPKGNLVKSPDDPASFKIIGLAHTHKLKKYSYLRRVFQEREYGNKLSELILIEKPDIVISGNTPLDAQNILKKTCNKSHIEFIFWVQDFYSIAIQRFIKIPLISFIASRYYLALEAKMLRDSDGVVVITDDFLPTLRSWSVKLDKVVTIPNWAPVNELPLVDKVNAWSEDLLLSDTMNFIYSGTLGLKHNPQLLVDLALKFIDDKKVRIIVISEGLGADFLRVKKQELNLTNLILMGFQPFDRYPEVLGSADILISILEEDAGQFSVPSKVLSYLCSGKPILLSVPLDNLSSKIVSDNQAGLVSAPADKEKFLESAVLLSDNSDLRAKFGINARKYAENTFDIDRISAEFLNVIKMASQE